MITSLLTSIILGLCPNYCSTDKINNEIPIVFYENYEEQDIYSSDGTKYLLISNLDGDGYVIFDEQIGQCIYEGLDENPFNDCQSEKKYFAIENNNVYFYAYDNGVIWDVFDKEYKVVLDSNVTDEIHRYEGYTFGGNRIIYQNDYDTFMNDESIIKISNSKYFWNLNQNYSYNRSGNCTIIAFEMLLSYFDSFYDDDIVPEEYDKISVNKSNTSLDWKDWDESAGSGFYDFYYGDNRYEDDRFENLIWNYAISQGWCGHNDSGDPSGQSSSEMLNTYAWYMDNVYGKNNYQRKTSVGNLADWMNKRTINLIKEAVNNNYPLIAACSDHAFVVFGYDDNYVYLNAGFNNYTIYMLPWKVFRDLGYDFAAYYVINSEHTHSNNYYSEINGCTYCVCGMKSNNEKTIKMDGNTISSTDDNNVTISGTRVSKNNNYAIDFSPTILSFGSVTLTYNNPIKFFSAKFIELKNINYELDIYFYDNMNNEIYRFNATSYSDLKDTTSADIYLSCKNAYKVYIVCNITENAQNDRVLRISNMKYIYS